MTLDVGRTFGLVFKLMTQHVALWVQIACIFMLPLAFALPFMETTLQNSLSLYFQALGQYGDSVLQTENDVELLLVQLGMQFYGYLFMGALCWGASQTLRGHKVWGWHCALQALRRIIPIFFLALLDIGATLVGLGMCILPGLIFMACWGAFWYSALPAILSENIGMADAMARSQHLSQGCHLTVLGLSFMTGGAKLLIVVLFAGLAVMVPSLTVPGVVLAAIFSHILPALGMSAAHHELRMAREGLSEEELIEVFS